MSKRNFGEITPENQNDYLKSVENYNPPSSIPYVQDEEEKARLDEMVANSRKRKEEADEEYAAAMNAELNDPIAAAAAQGAIDRSEEEEDKLELDDYYRNNPAVNDDTERDAFETDVDVLSKQTKKMKLGGGRRSKKSKRRKQKKTKRRRSSKKRRSSRKRRGSRRRR
jgi:hypothetical protein